MITPAYESFVNDICMEADAKNLGSKIINAIKSVVGKYTEFIKTVLAKISNAVVRVVGLASAKIAQLKAEAKAAKGQFKLLTEGQYNKLMQAKGIYCASNMAILQSGIAKVFKKYVGYTQNLFTTTVQPAANADAYNMQINQVIQKATDSDANVDAFNKLTFIRNDGGFDLKGYAAFAKKFCNDLKTGSKEVTSIASTHMNILNQHFDEINYMCYRSSMQIETAMFNNSSSIVRQAIAFFKDVNSALGDKDHNLLDTKQDENAPKLLNA